MIRRRHLLAPLAALSLAPAALAKIAARRTFDVHDFGAIGDGRMRDTAAIKRAIDAAAAAGGRVLLRTGHTYLTGPLQLKGNIDFHLAGTARLIVSTDPADYAVSDLGVFHASGADDLTISGTGSIDGRSREFMERYDPVDEWWIPKPFRPRLFVLENCARLVIRDVTIRNAPSWTIHLLGCRQVLIDHVTIANQLDVPNCDGIDPDHCQDVKISHCRITCGDDAIVIKTTAAHPQYGPSRNFHVHDCVIETQDAGLKIGTETTQDIHDILFERCRILSSCRGLCIQLRDAGDVYNVTFRDISFVARYHSAPWWGRGEAISFTAIPRKPGGKTGTIRNIIVQNVTGRAENSIRIEGLGGSRVRDVTLDHVVVRFDRWTRYPGGMFDNRPTSAIEPVEQHATPAFSIRHADRTTLDHCTVRWGARVPDYFTYALEALDAPGLTRTSFSGEHARSSLPAIKID